MTQITSWQLHESACAKGAEHYTDPETGFRVFTEVALRARGRCCGSGCRHCPYAHGAVDLQALSQVAQQPVWLTRDRPAKAPVDVLFWSGGKDSFLAYRALERQKENASVLLTTFDSTSRSVAHQDVHIDDIIRQAQWLRVPLLGIPLHPELKYEEQVRQGLSLINCPARLVFGDLHLEHIRSWRERALGEALLDPKVPLHFPLWHASYESLFQDLELSGVVCEVSAVTEPVVGVVQVGDLFDRQLVAGLPDEVDAFGECGEFHTLAKVWEGSSQPLD